MTIWPGRVFSCATCGIELSEPLCQLPEDSLQFTIGDHALPAKRFIRLSSPWTYRDFFTGHQAGHGYLSPDGSLIAFEAGDYLLNIHDVNHGIFAHSRYGCCGFQPRNELNAHCSNGHPISSLHSDCWAASVFRLAHRYIGTSERCR